MEMIDHLIKCLRLLSKRARVTFFVIVGFQAVVSLLDLLGLSLILHVVLSSQKTESTASISMPGSFPFIGQLIENTSESSLLLFVVAVFITKGLVALWLHSVNNKIMSRETMRVVDLLSKSIFGTNSAQRKNLTTQQASYLIYNSTETIFRDTMIPASVIFSDGILFAAVGLNLFVTMKVLFLPVVLYFLTVFFLLRISEKRKMHNAFRSQIENEMLSRSLVFEVITSLRELYVSTKLSFFIAKIRNARAQGISASATVTFSQLMPKYVYEIALFGGMGVISLVAALTNHSNQVLSMLAIFLISSSRMIPSLLRVQYYLGCFHKSAQQSGEIFKNLEELSPDFSSSINHNSNFSDEAIESAQFHPTISVQDLTFTYSKASAFPTIDSVSLYVDAGESVAIVGHSGAGKSTLIDLIMGYIQPDSGSVELSGLSPRMAFQLWPGKTAYVPQKITIYQGTLFENVAVGENALSDDLEVKIERVNHVLKNVGLKNLIESLPFGVNTNLSEFGSSLSGGQMQRIGIARALYTDPKILILDESTSSLDTESESEIMNLLFSLKREKTLLFITHRLSTIKNVDRIYYAEKGRILADGDFESLRKKVPDFDNQVVLLDVN